MMPFQSLVIIIIIVIIIIFEVYQVKTLSRLYDVYPDGRGSHYMCHELEKWARDGLITGQVINDIFFAI